jgi:hypothetical protein
VTGKETFAVGGMGNEMFPLGIIGSDTFKVGTAGISVVILGTAVIRGGFPPPKSQGCLPGRGVGLKRSLHYMTLGHMLHVIEQMNR